MGDLLILPIRDQSKAKMTGAIIHAETISEQVGLPLAVLLMTGEALGRETIATLPKRQQPAMLSEMVEAAMLRAGGRRALAEACGYRNVSKGIRRIDEWLHLRGPRPDNYVRVARGLGVPIQELAAAVEESARRLEEAKLRAMAEDGSFKITLRLMAAVYSDYRVEGRNTVAQAVDVATSLAQIKRHRVRLRLPDSTEVFFGRDAELEQLVPGLILGTSTD